MFDIGEREWRRTARFFAPGGRVGAGADSFAGFPAQTRLRGDRVWIGNTIEYSLREYDVGGRLLRTIERGDVPLPPPVSYRQGAFDFGSFDPPLWIGSDLGLVSRRRELETDVEEWIRRWDTYMETGNDAAIEGDFESAIDLVDGQGRILGTMSFDGAPWESIGSLAAAGPGGVVYTMVYEPYPHVRRYRVVLREP